ncbi:DUF3224 domain-containing protein [Kribbella albertanoniae]|uniref:DUF3224 family protein n=1 Tax=Kribbella albertanoniae TaxID=1266829 RepID=A0A4R4QB89_9ACTN|nr:DUF3224 domain-containing protein [Kribbella albertanoniae]TDC32617.1 DUF3224 family protein [Kribbella albertanoniae]
MSESVETVAAFTIELQPAEAVLEGTGRFDFSKVWTGGMTGTSTGLMLSAGDPASGTAGYVALELFRGSVDGLEGSVVLQQFGTMSEEAVLYYEFAPGSGTGQLAGLVGAVEIDTSGGGHDVRVRYRLTR